LLGILFLERLSRRRRNPCTCPLNFR
jgi:hypothetical protein